MTGRNYWSGISDNNYLPNYEGQLSGAAAWQARPPEIGWLGLIKQRYNGHLKGQQTGWQLRGSNPGTCFAPPGECELCSHLSRVSSAHSLGLP